MPHGLSLSSDHRGHLCEASTEEAEPIGSVRVGVDLADIAAVADSIETFGPRYTRRLFTSAELADCEGPPPMRARHLAARFAAKEAMLKVLRRVDDGLRPTDIEVVRSPDGSPFLRLHGRAAALAASAGLESWSLSMSHECNVAAAVVVASIRPGCRDDGNRVQPEPNEE